jgi:hypothetical protein
MRHAVYHDREAMNNTPRIELTREEIRHAILLRIAHQQALIEDARRCGLALLCRQRRQALRRLRKRLHDIEGDTTR